MTVRETARIRIGDGANKNIVRMVKRAVASEREKYGFSTATELDAENTGLHEKQITADYAAALFADFMGGERIQ